MQCSHSVREANIPYPEPLPDSIALAFLPGIVTSDTLDFNSAFSPDGRSYYFSRSANGRWDIYLSQHDGKQWGPPVLAPFSEKEYSEADAVFAPDGMLYYISDRPRNTSDTTRDFDIWRIRPEKNGRWSLPENVAAVNSDSSEYYVAFGGNGNLYFASSRPGGYGSFDLYISRSENGAFTAPENLGPSINSPQMEHDPAVTRDEQVILFTSVERPDTYGSADIYYSVKNDDDKWSDARNAGARVNTPTYEYCGYLSPDQKYYFFSSEYDVKWIDTRYLPVKIEAN